jgi:hypothetical protein
MNSNSDHGGAGYVGPEKTTEPPAGKRLFPAVLFELGTCMSDIAKSWGIMPWTSPKPASQDESDD